jgi:peptide/nickel transport system substrate-binding protein
LLERILGRRPPVKPAALMALAGLVVALTGAPVAGAQQDGQGKLTFTVGMANDIDSMNPFLGYLAEAYEVWGTIYDS